MQEATNGLGGEIQSGRQKQWLRPVLQKLPITATENKPGKNTNGDEGNCTGKGDAALCTS
jgi:hypothetical protein